MRIIRNERRIRTLSSIGQYAALGGFLALLAGLVISVVRPGWFAPMLGSVVLGFLLAVVGGTLGDRYAGPLAHHKALAEMLKGLDYRHTLLQYVLPASHVLLDPGGCTVFLVKTQGGEVTYEGDEGGRWRHRQRLKFFRQLAGQEGVGAPHVEADQERRKLERYLEEHLPDADDVPVQAAIVFVNPDVELEAEDSPVPAFYCKKVKNWLRGPGEREPLPDNLHRRLEETLGVDREDDQ